MPTTSDAASDGTVRCYGLVVDEVQAMAISTTRTYLLDHWHVRVTVM
jgi:hypothetical protein